MHCWGQRSCRGQLGSSKGQFAFPCRHNFDLVLSDIQEIGSQTRKTYKGLESWAMGTLDFFPNQFGGFRMCIPLKGH